jgi:hypothetical protein
VKRRKYKEAEPPKGDYADRRWTGEAAVQGETARTDVGPERRQRKEGATRTGAGSSISSRMLPGIAWKLSSMKVQHRSSTAWRRSCNAAAWEFGSPVARQPSNTVSQHHGGSVVRQANSTAAQQHEVVRCPPRTTALQHGGTAARSPYGTTARRQ